jgi:uncharacterized protein (TIGR03435 family)
MSCGMTGRTPVRWPGNGSLDRCGTDPYQMRNSIASRVLCSLLVLSSWLATGQTNSASSEFDIALVKQANSATDLVENHLPNLRVNHGQITFTNLQLQNLIMVAYGVGRGQVSAPKSLESALANRYDLIARVAQHVGKEQIQQMLQRLLVERFKIALHRESKSMTVYALVVAVGGTKMKQVPDDTQESGCNRSFAQTQGGSLAADCHCMRSGDIAAALTAYAPGYLGWPVVDHTGLSGLYDFRLEWITRAESDAGSSGPTIFVALDLLGLKLERRRQTLEVIVIDHAEKNPVDN